MSGSLSRGSFLTILLTTHCMEDADQLSDRIGIIDQGKTIALDTPEALKQRIHQKEVIRLEVSGWHAGMESEQFPRRAWELEKTRK